LIVGSGFFFGLGPTLTNVSFWRFWPNYHSPMMEKNNGQLKDIHMKFLCKSLYPFNKDVCLLDCHYPLIWLPLGPFISC
jgi:hypothetical protein